MDQSNKKQTNGEPMTPPMEQPLSKPVRKPPKAGVYSKLDPLGDELQAMTDSMKRLRTDPAYAAEIAQLAKELTGEGD